MIIVEILNRMREETLKNLIYIIDKLNEKNLQERLVRSLMNLQNDTESSIRTNVTIFLGKYRTVYITFESYVY